MSVTPAQFDQGDNPLGQKFLANLQQAAQQAADGCSIASSTLLVSYTQGLGTTIEMPSLIIPPIPALVAFPAIITSTSGAACAWTAQQPATVSTWATSVDNGGAPLSGTTTSNQAYEINGRQGFPANYQVLMWQERANDGSFAYFFAAPNSYFPVKIEKTSGSDGTASAPAGWLYTVRTLPWNGTSGGATLGTGVGLSRPRPNGGMIFQTGSVGYGEAFYDGSTLRLWDAGEVPATYDCDNP